MSVVTMIKEAEKSEERTLSIMDMDEGDFKITWDPDERDQVDMAEAAFTEMLGDLRARAAALDIPSQPRDAWLGGNYLANASQFEDVEQFWLDIERFVDDVKSTETQIFHDEYVRQVEAAGLAADSKANQPPGPDGEALARFGC